MNEIPSTEGNQNAAPSRRSGQTTEHLAAKAHETVDRVARTAAEAEEEVRARAAEVARKARQSEERAMQAAEESLGKAEAYVRKNPLLSAGIAFAAGVALSALLRR